MFFPFSLGKKLHLQCRYAVTSKVITMECLYFSLASIQSMDLTGAQCGRSNHCAGTTGGAGRGKIREWCSTVVLGFCAPVPRRYPPNQACHPAIWLRYVRVYPRQIHRLGGNPVMYSYPSGSVAPSVLMASTRLWGLRFRYSRTERNSSKQRTT
jgi:hypothetical protein